MVKAIRYTSLLVFVLGMTQSICAQNPFKHSERYTMAQGLPHNRISSIAQDEDGFLWIGTINGIARYDGAYFKIYKHEQDNPNSIVDNRIRDLCIDGSNLWIGTHIGLSKLDLFTGEIRNYTWTHKCESVSEYEKAEEAVQKIHRDRDGNIWIGTQHCGFAKYFPEQDTFYLLAPDTSKMPVFDYGPLSKQNKIRAMNIHAFVDDISNDSIIWIGGVSVLIRYNKITGRSRNINRLYDSPKMRHLAHTFQKLYQDKNGILYTDTDDFRISTYDPKTGKFDITPKIERPAADIMRNSISKFIEVSDSVVWITTISGIIEYDFVHHRYLRHWKHDPLAGRYYGAQFIDKDGRILIGTIDGLYIYDPIQQQFESSIFGEIYPGNGGYVYGVTHDTRRNRYYACARASDGLYYLDLDTRKWNRVELPKNRYSAGKVSLNNLAIMANGKYLLSTVTGILSFDPDKLTISNTQLDLPLSVNKLQDVFVDSRNIAWINTREDGIYSWEMESNVIRNFRVPEKLNTNAASDSETFMEDSRGNIWMKRRLGYSVYNPVKDDIQHYFPENMHGSYNGGLGEDNFGNVWIASVLGWIGAIHVDSIDKGIYRKINISGASKSNTMQGMAAGPGGFLWCGMKEGLVKINPQTEEQIVYNYDYGDNPNVMYSFQFMEDGTMVFGKRNEIVFANPNSLRKNKQLPIPYINEINVGSESYQSEAVHHRLKGLDLTAEQNFFSIRFSTIGMSFGNENSIQYRLIGFQDNWIDAKDQRLASYTNVPSGNYVFELRATNNEGYPNPDVLRMPISVATPWYATTIARGIFAILILSLIYAGYRYRINQIRKEERMQAEFQRKIADVEMSALRAQMNPHFIFNCLNSIENFVIKNDTLKASTYLNDFARLIRLILQNSRSEYVTLADEVEGLELYLQMESLRFTNKFDYELHISDNVSVTTISIPPMLIQPYAENAIWHGLMHKKAPGSLHIYLSKVDNILHCEIVDDGIGRKRSLEINEKRSIKRKKSVGMSITADRIKLLNELYRMNTEIKIIDLYNERDEACGTRVELSIPV